MSEGNDSNIEISEELGEYFSSDDIKFAIFINGKWGSGKTYYVTKYIKNFESKHNDTIVCMVSLFGLSEIQDLEYDISVKINQAISLRKINKEGLQSQHLKTSANVIGFLTRKFAGRDLIKFFNKELNDILSKEYDIIFIFDDIERTKIEHESLIGFINTLLDVYRSKIIIICNEEKLNDEKGVFNSYKEKIAAFTLYVNPEFDSAFDESAKVIKDPGHYELFMARKELVRKTFHESGYDNLRNINRLAYDFKRIAPKIYKNALENSSFMDSFFHKLCMLSFEINASELHAGDIYKFLSTRSRLRLGNAQKEPREKPEELADKYTQVSLVPREIIEFWTIFFRERRFDELINDYYCSTYEKKDDSIPADYLYRLGILKDKSQFTMYYEAMLADLNTNKYQDLSSILFSFGVWMYLAKEHLVPDELDAISDKLIASFQRFLEQSGESIDISKLKIEDHMDHLWCSMLESEHFSKIKQTLRELLGNEILKRASVEAVSLVDQSSKENIINNLIMIVKNRDYNDLYSLKKGYEFIININTDDLIVAINMLPINDISNLLNSLFEFINMANHKLEADIEITKEKMINVYSALKGSISESMHPFDSYKTLKYISILAGYLQINTNDGN